MAAVTLSVIGRVTNNPTLAVESSKNYGQALCELHRALWEECLMYREETLAACSCALRGPNVVQSISIYNCLTDIAKLLECTDNNLQSWVAQAQDVARSWKRVGLTCMIRY